MVFGQYKLNKYLLTYYYCFIVFRPVVFYWEPYISATSWYVLRAYEIEYWGVTDVAEIHVFWNKSAFWIKSTASLYIYKEVEKLDSMKKLIFT